MRAPRQINPVVAPVEARGRVRPRRVEALLLPLAELPAELLVPGPLLGRLDDEVLVAVDRVGLGPEEGAGGRGGVGACRACECLDVVVRRKRASEGSRGVV